MNAVSHFKPICKAIYQATLETVKVTAAKTALEFISQNRMRSYLSSVWCKHTARAAQVDSMSIQQTALLGLPTFQIIFL